MASLSFILYITRTLGVYLTLDWMELLGGKKEMFLDGCLLCLTTMVSLSFILYITRTLGVYLTLDEGVM